MIAQAKTINLLLYDGNLDGVISIEDSNWNAGELYAAPRGSVSDLLKTDACNKYGVYLLLSQNMVYVGQSSDLAKRLTQHIIGKDWWESAVILTTKDDSLSHTDIDYLESVLIDKAFDIQRLDCDNKKKGNPPKVDKFRKVYLSQYLDEALFLMQLIGINVFSDNKPPAKKGATSPAKPLIKTVDVHTQLSLGKRSKAEAIQFLKSQGASLDAKISYSALQAPSKAFWINPRVSMLSHDWSIILNDTGSCKIIVLRVPASSLNMRSDTDSSGLKARTDRPELIELRIGIDDYVDKVSGVDFSKYVSNTIKY